MKIEFENELDKENNMKKINLWNTYYEIENSLDELSAYDSYSPYQEELNKLDDKIEELYKYLGIRRLKIDIGYLKSGEMVQIFQNENGVWLIPLRPDEHNIMVNLTDSDVCVNCSSLADIFYE